jgi:hypothetical protein
MTVELPARLLADRVTWALALACGVAIEVTLARHPGLPPGAGVATGGLLLLWQWLRLRRRPSLVSIGPKGVCVQLCGQRRGQPVGSSIAVPATGPRARVLGRSAVLHWRGANGAGTLWLTPADLPGDVLRSIRVHIHAGRSAVAG